MKSILYLLVTEDKSSFKIGITDNLEARHARLSAVWGKFDLASSRIVFGTRRDISGLEKILHYLLNKWRVQPSATAEGHSEWFLIECFDKAVEIITTAVKLRDLQPDNPIIHTINVNIHKEHGNIRKEKPITNISDKLDDLKKFFKRDFNRQSPTP